MDNRDSKMGRDRLERSQFEMKRTTFLISLFLVALFLTILLSIYGCDNEGDSGGSGNVITDDNYQCASNQRSCLEKPCCPGLVTKHTGGTWGEDVCVCYSYSYVCDSLMKLSEMCSIEYFYQCPDDGKTFSDCYEYVVEVDCALLINCVKSVIYSSLRKSDLTIFL
jgi:hypothetical protein